MTPPTDQEYRQRIWGRIKAHSTAISSREDAEAWIKTRTGLDLHPGNYAAILSALEQR